MDKEEKIKNKVIQTYAEDMAFVIENDKEGLVRKIIHGEEQRENEKKNLSPNSQKNKLLIILSLCFVFLSMAIILSFIFFKKENTVVVEKQFIPIIFNDKSKFFEIKDLKKDEIVQTIINETNRVDLKNGGVEGIYLSLDKNVVSLRKFLNVVGSSLVLPSLDYVSDNFLMGVVNTQNRDFFILIKVRSIPDIFTNLRTWEDEMFQEMHAFWNMGLSAETNDLLSKGFVDGVVENRNARILYDKDNHIVMMYIFADDNSIIITNTISAAHELMLRIASSKLAK